MENPTDPTLSESSPDSSDQEENDVMTDLPVIKSTDSRTAFQGKLPPIDDSKLNSKQHPTNRKVPEIHVYGARGSIHPVDIDPDPKRTSSSAESGYTDLSNFNKGIKYRKRLDRLSIVSGIFAGGVMLIGALSYVFHPHIFDTAVALWGGAGCLLFGIYGATILVHCKHDCRFPVYHAYIGISLAIIFSFGLTVAFCISLGFDKQYLFCTYEDGVGHCSDIGIDLRTPPNFNFAVGRIGLAGAGLVFSVVLIFLHGSEFKCVRRLSKLEQLEEEGE